VSENKNNNENKNNKNKEVTPAQGTQSKTPEKTGEQKNRFQHTLNLPQTDFSIRANAAQKEPEILQQWEREDLFNKAMDANEGQQKFILHDGPQYANGNMHLGHAINNILKDIVCKSKRMAGFWTPITQGWDCHGLPIDLKVSIEHGLDKDKNKVDRLTFKKYCREYVNHWISVQKQELKEMGKLADYKTPYITMSPSYEAAILNAFALFVEKGYIERKSKTVPWCASCQTVLAMAEIEHKDRTDPSIFVSFPLKKEQAQIIFPYCFEQDPALEISMLVWTTTPWTLPLNRAVAINPKAIYCIISGKEQHTAYVIAKDLVDTVCKTIGLEKNILCECDAIVFDKKQAHHPFVSNLEVPIILDDSVLLTDGTACMHSAPGCGPEDYLLGVKYGLDIYSPISPDGHYTQAIEPKSLAGLLVTAGQGAVITLLQEHNRLVHKGSIEHAYPHCWRCRQGLIFRATDQWFCDLRKNNLVERALEEISHMQFVPEASRARLQASVAHRTEWCISRQRQWGVPIPAIVCNQCSGYFLDAKFIRSVASHVSREGIEFWDTVTFGKLTELGLLDKNFSCASCGNNSPDNFIIERDVLDVWFDSGLSHHIVLVEQHGEQGLPADLYLEASDQHRGWFQSSLLCGMVLSGHTPTRAILTHGYTVDKNRHKMSKSLGNVVAPHDVISKFSRDILRLWVASVDFEGDIVVSDQLFNNVAEVYKKIRNTCRFLLSNLYDFNPERDSVPVEKLSALDHYALATLHDVYTNILRAYDEYHFASIIQQLNHYCVNNLSAQYLDIAKDRLYVERADGPERRATQTVLYTILDVLTHLMAPIFSFTAEEIASHYQKDKKESIHLQHFVPAPNILQQLTDNTHPDYIVAIEQGVRILDTESVSHEVLIRGTWNILEELRAAVLKTIEGVRETGAVKHSLEAQVTLFIDGTNHQGAIVQQFLQALGSSEVQGKFLKDWFIVSQVTFAQTGEECDASSLEWLRVRVAHADGVKCPRCWQWEDTQNPEGLCARCERVLKC
jgi:isoleucyl-tRNA synthetase